MNTKCHWPAGMAWWTAAVLALALGAQAAPPSKPKPEPPPVSTTRAPLDRNHKLAPGDVIQIDVARQDSLSGPRKLFVDGSIELPMLGVLNVSGLTVKQLQAKLVVALGRELRRPRVSVSLLDVYVPPPPAPKTFRITVLGAVSQPGVVDLTRHMYLREVLAKVSPTERADLGQIHINYPDGRSHIADMSAFLVKGKSPDDLLIQGGEEIIVVEKPEVQQLPPVHVIVLGQVAKTGQFNLPAGSGILAALTQAGEATRDAELREVEITNARRPGKKRSVNVERLMGGEIKANYLLRDGDVVTVKSKPLLVLVLGDFAKPGQLAIREGDKVLPVLLTAGLNGSAALSKAQLIRKGKDEKPVRQKLNLKALMKGNQKYNHLLQNGDVIYVPSKKPRQDGLGRLGAISPIFFFARALFPF